MKNLFILFFILISFATCKKEKIVIQEKIINPFENDWGELSGVDIYSTVGSDLFSNTFHASKNTVSGAAGYVLNSSQGQRAPSHRTSTFCTMYPSQGAGMSSVIFHWINADSPHLTLKLELSCSMVSSPDGSRSVRGQFLL